MPQHRAAGGSTLTRYPVIGRWLIPGQRWAVEAVCSEGYLLPMRSRHCWSVSDELTAAEQEVV